MQVFYKPNNPRPSVLKKTLAWDIKLSAHLKGACLAICLLRYTILLKVSAKELFQLSSYIVQLLLAKRREGSQPKSLVHHNVSID